jgi:hypothetical protein
MKARIVSLLCIHGALFAACVGPGAPSQVPADPARVSNVPAHASVPVLISPSNGAQVDNGCNPDREVDGIIWEFAWSVVPAATRYHLTVQRLGAALPVIDISTSVPSYRYESAGAYIIEANRFNWQWKVEAEANGQFVSYSPGATFNVEPLNADCR